MKMNCFNPYHKKKSAKRNPNSLHASSSSDCIPCPSTANTSALCIQDSGDLRLVFDKFDANGDGRISTDELESMLRCLGFSGRREEVESMMREADADGDGFISVHEFLQMNTQETDSSKCMEDLRNAFTIFDRDNNGLISAD